MVPLETSELITHEKETIRNVVVILATSSIVSVIFQRLRLATIPGFIVAGIIAGPQVLGFAHSGENLTEISHLAVVLLMFGIGMELHLASLRSNLWKLLSAALGSLVFSLIAIFSIGNLFGLSFVQSVAIAMAFSLSSTAVVLRVLSSRRELSSSHGQLSLAILVIQDLAVIGMLALLPVLAVWDTGGVVDIASDGIGFDVVLSEAVIKLLGVATLFLFAKKIIPFLLREALRDSSGELPILIGVSTALVTAYISQKLGFSLEMGAFLAGFVLASSPFKYHLAGRVGSLRDLFMAIFFTALGMELDLNIVFQYWYLIVLLTFLLLLVKTATIYYASWFSGIPSRLALRSALGLSQAGEFSLVLLSQAIVYGILNETLSSIGIGVVVSTLILTPTIFLLAPQIYLRFSKTTSVVSWFKNSDLLKSEEEEMNADVIIAGFGPLGRHLASNLEKCGIPYLVIELNPDTVKAEKKKSIPILFGDISDNQILEKVQITKVSVLAITFPEVHSSIAAVAIARAKASGLHIIVRAPTTRSADALLKSGADQIVIDEKVSAEEMYSIISAANIKAEVLE